MFGYWKVLERVPNHQGDMVYYSCLCTKCNKTIKEVSYKHLKSGASTKCQICNGKQMSEKNIKDESGKIYGYLKVIKKVPDDLENRHKKDLIKNQYCFKNNIPLIRIPYDKDYTIEDLKLATTKFLLTPENEKFYYETRLNQ